MAAPSHVLVIGSGWIGQRHIEALRLTGRARVGICEVDADRRAGVAERLGLRETFGALDDALRHSWDAAVVATPAPLHAEIGLRLAEAGIPALVEKPVAVALNGIAEWQAAAQRRHASVMIGYVFRAHPVLQAVRDAVQSGRVGEIVQVVAQRGANLPVRRPDYAASYYADRSTGGGVVHDILSHVYNAVEWLVGPMHFVAADVVHACLPGVEVEDTVHAIARHGPILASYSVNQHQPAAEFVITLNGKRGSVRAVFHERCWEIANEPDRGWTRHSLTALGATEWFARQANAFLDVVAGRRSPLCSLGEGVQTLQAVLATLRAATQRDAWIEVEPNVAAVSGKV